MPQKTRRQKLASKARRQMPTAAHAETPLQRTEETAVTVFKNDFKKSIMVITIITALEIITYFGTMYYHSR